MPMMPISASLLYVFTGADPDLLTELDGRAERSLSLMLSSVDDPSACLPSRWFGLAAGTACFVGVVSDASTAVAIVLSAAAPVASSPAGCTFLSVACR